jgi:hypothetical protein
MNGCELGNWLIGRIKVNQDEVDKVVSGGRVVVGGGDLERKRDLCCRRNTRDAQFSK